MRIDLHANATTTPKIRAYIQASSKSVAELSRELGLSEKTIRRWKGRKDVHDRSHRRHDLGQSTSAAEEELICALRRDLDLPLDDLAEVMRRCVNARLSRSAVYRCLKRHGLSGRAAVEKPKPGTFEEAGFGVVHVDLKHLTRLEGRPSYVFVAIERSTRFVHAEVIGKRDGATVAACFERFLAAFGHPVHTVISDNGGEFTDRFAVLKPGKGADVPTGGHPFDKVCAAHAIEHRLIRPARPQTNGMAERFNRRLSEALRARPANGRNAGKNKFKTHTERNRFITDVVYAYNRTRLKCLNYKAPLQVLANQTEPYTFAGARNCLIFLQNQEKLNQSDWNSSNLRVKKRLGR